MNAKQRSLQVIKALVISEFRVEARRLMNRHEVGKVLAARWTLWSILHNQVGMSYSEIAYAWHWNTTAIQYGLSALEDWMAYPRKRDVEIMRAINRCLDQARLILPAVETTPEFNPVMEGCA